jgi:putative hydrolase of the HAD superfamily
LGCRLHDWNLESRDYTGGTAKVCRGLILDLDDTLYPLEHFVQSGLMAVARHLEDQHGIAAMDAFATMSAARCGKERGFELQAVCSRYCLPNDLVAGLLHVLRAHRPLLRLPRETASVLTSLRDAEWRLVILTNGLPAIQRAKVQALGLDRLVDHVVYAEEHASGGKPAATAFREALRRLGVPVFEAICVGDDLVRDIAGARAIGLRTIRLITPGAVSQPGIEADATIESLTVLPDVAASLLDGVRTDAA